VLDLAACANLLPASTRSALRQPQLNAFMSLGPAAWRDLRATLQHLLSRENREQTDRALLEAALLPIRDLRLQLPCTIGDYTDFYASRDHARRVGELFRPEKPLLDNYDWIPIAYHGRASSIVPSGTLVRRPAGQMRGQMRGPASDQPCPDFGPTQRLDYELELGYFIGPGNQLGEPIALDVAEDHLFGVTLLNDWSARDIQAWEYQPLGPFLGKNFCTTISPWITPMAALAPFRVPPRTHENGTLPYLDGNTFGLDLNVEARLSTERTRAEGMPDLRISVSSSAHLFWTPAQMVAHHTVNGCNLRPGDLLATGTISGPSREEAGCLLELTAQAPLQLPNGETRRFLEDGDEVTLVAWAQKMGDQLIRLGQCRGRLIPFGRLSRGPASQKDSTS
jgi:fumarylacetoacetase